MNLTRFAIENNRLTFVLVIALVLFGFNAYRNLPKSEDPGFTIRTAVITTRLSGASPERMEQLVTDKIEQVVQQMPELDNVTSTTQRGISTVNANFLQEHKNMRPIFDSLRRKVESIQRDLPQGVQGPFVNDEFGDVFGVIYTLTGDGFSYAELKLVADEVRDDLLLLDQVAKVEIEGDQDEVVFIDYNNARLRELGLSPQQLGNTLKSVNILSPGGELRIGRERITLEPSGNFETIDDIRRVIVSIPNSTQGVYLEDIAHVYRGYQSPPSSAVHASGKPALSISISMKNGGNILEMGQSLARVMPDIKARYPHGIELEAIAYQPKLVDQSISGFMGSLVQAVSIVFIIMLVFLGLRTGLVVAALIPSAMAITFVVMQVFGVGINKMSLAALIIALGLLVDNGIVMAEGILVRLEKGEQQVSAAIATGKEMLVPLLTSSLTTSAAFLPILLAKSSVGEFTGDIARVVTMALLLSWLLALTFIPLIATYLARAKQKKTDQSADFAGSMYRTYRRLLTISLRFKWVFLVIVACLFALGIKGLDLVPKAFIPASTAPIVNAKFDMPVGTSIETTEEIAYALEQFITDQWVVTEEEAADGKDGVLNWMTFVGISAPRFVLGYNPAPPSSRHITLIANTTDYRMIADLSRSVETFAREAYPDLELQLKKLENGPPVSYPIQLRLMGQDKAVLSQLVVNLKNHLYTLPEVAAVNDDWGPQVKKLRVNVNQERARRAGVTSEDVAQSLQASLSGVELTQFREFNKLIPVTLRFTASDRQDLAKLEGITIYASGSSAKVPLKQVADIEIVWQPGLIKRRDRQRAMTVNVQLNPGITAVEVNAKLLPWLDQQTTSWPQGYKYEEGGESEASGDAAASIIAGLPLAGLIIMFLLVAQFNSIRKPIIILMTIPLGMIGITAGLIIADSIFGFFTILALISLAGIIINNAIVLLDRIKIENEENGLALQPAIFEACQQRLRPILLTTATTVGGMMPLWISHDPMFETMAVSIIFGLVFATLLTLVFVPVMYSLLYKVSFSDWEYDANPARQQ